MCYLKTGVASYLNCNRIIFPTLSMQGRWAPSLLRDCFGTLIRLLRRSDLPSLRLAPNPKRSLHRDRLEIYVLCYLKKSNTPLFEILCRSRPLGPVPVTGLLLLRTKCAAHHFVCRGHLPGTEPKEVRPQGLIRNFLSNTPVFQKFYCRMIDNLNFQIAHTLEIYFQDHLISKFSLKIF